MKSPLSVGAKSNALTPPRGRGKTPMFLLSLTLVTKIVSPISICSQKMRLLTPNGVYPSANCDPKFIFLGFGACEGNAAGKSRHSD